MFEEGRLGGGTGTLIGGFDEVITGRSPGMEGLDARDGRQIDPAGFFLTFEAIVVGLVSGRSDLGLEGSRPTTHRTDLGMIKPRRGWQLVKSRVWRTLFMVW